MSWYLSLMNFLIRDMSPDSGCCSGFIGFEGCVSSVVDLRLKVEGSGFRVEGLVNRAQ